MNDYPPITPSSPIASEKTASFPSTPRSNGEEVWDRTPGVSRMNSIECWDYTIELECLQGPEGGYSFGFLNF